MSTDLIDSARLLFLRELTRDVVEACRVRPGTTREGLPENITGRTLFAAAGDGYPAFWLEDFTFALDCGFITTDEVKDMLDLTFEAQQGPETWHLDSGARVPPFQIPDHVLFDAGAVYFAGTYSSGPDQGGGMWGNLPELDDNFHVAQTASWYFQQTQDIGFLTAAINDMPVIERLERAFHVPPYDPETQLIRVSPDERGTNWGFVDTIAMTGDLLFCSLLRMRAADRLANFFSALHENEKAAKYRGIADTIKSSIPVAFGTGSGWLLAATGQCRQHDVWGTVFALYEDALSGELRERALAAVLDAYNNGTATFRGNVRHVLTSEDFSSTSAWEATPTEHNNYQNGGYWGTPSGWYLHALAQIDRAACARFIAEYIDELIEGDYRRPGTRGSPLEWFHPDGFRTPVPIYMTSVACPLAALIRLGC